MSARPLGERSLLISASIGPEPGEPPIRSDEVACILVYRDGRAIKIVYPDGRVEADAVNASRRVNSLGSPFGTGFRTEKRKSYYSNGGLPLVARCRPT
jgi:hypothetical protein